MDLSSITIVVESCALVVWCLVLYTLRSKRPKMMCRKCKRETSLTDLTTERVLFTCDHCRRQLYFQRVRS